MKAYKVLHRVDGQLISARTAPGLLYAPGVTTFPVYGRLFVFPREADARCFAGVLDDEIWLAECHNLYRQDVISFYQDSALDFWNGVNVEIAIPPAGTYTTDSVTLIRRVA